jgi:2-methylcitrate dehydratase PrpD
MVHAQEFDCVHEGAVLHPFTVVLPVLLAEAQCRGMTGADYAAACAAGVDTAVGLGLAAKSQIKFFRPATCGLFGGIAALGRARRLSEDRLVDAFGYGLAFAAGTMQAHVEGTPALAASVGNAARVAFQAVDLAEAGLPGPKGAIDGPFGYLTLFETAHDIAPVLDALGTRWRATDVSWKPHPTGRACHGGIDMMIALRTQGLHPSQVEAITFTVTPLIHHLVGRPAVPSPDVNYARLCLPFAAASALLKGEVGLMEFTASALADPTTFDLARRITVSIAPNPDSAAFVPQGVEVRRRDGATLSARVDDLPGTPRRPLSIAEQHRKLERCTAFALQESGAAVAQRLIDVCGRLETLANVAVLADIACGEQER